MAKRFGGFTPEQLGKIVPEMQGMQADEQAKFLAATPGAAARVGAMTDKARSMIEGKPVGMAEGGLLAGLWPIASALASTVDPNAQSKDVEPTTAAPVPTSLDAAKQSYADSLAAVQAARNAQAADPTNTALTDAVTAAEAASTQAQQAQANALQQYQATDSMSAGEFLARAGGSPETLVTAATPTAMTPQQVASGELTAGTGQAPTAPQATTTAATAAAPVTTPTATPAAQVTPTTAADEIQTAVSTMEAATGKVGADALADAATMTPEQLNALGLDAAQIDAAQKVVAPEARTVQEGELISGPTVDMGRVETAVNFAAATGVPSTEATVQGQLTGLMEQFEGKEPPAWAAGAMRAATSALAARGLGASSMAGQAVVQAAMESALPIAMQDSQTAAQFEIQNLSNKQQTAMFAAQQRAQFLGMEFTQDFQARVANASRISDIANINFSAEQQIALENARMAQTVDLTNVSNKQAKIMADAATLSQMDLTNLSNRQQANIQNASAFLQMDMANLSNEQQATVFKNQAIVSSILSDQAAENAAKQFNASSENQTNQFYDNLVTQVSQFNVEQMNAVERFNAGEANALAEFNAAQLGARQQFNATNSLIIEQANAAWYQSIATTENANINEANRVAAQNATEMTALAFNAAMQETRDIMSYAFQEADNNATRATNLAIAQLDASSAAAASKASSKAGLWGALGSVASAIIMG